MSHMDLDSERERHLKARIAELEAENKSLEKAAEIWEENCTVNQARIAELEDEAKTAGKLIARLMQVAARTYLLEIRRNKQVE